jgi:hypothetical protein
MRRTVVADRPGSGVGGGWKELPNKYTLPAQSGVTLFGPGLVLETGSYAGAQ